MKKIGCGSEGCEREAKASRGMCWSHYNRWLGRTNPASPVDPSLEERFWAKVKPTFPNACWEWKGSRKPNGYGQFSDRENNDQHAHRAAWRLTRGPIPNGMFVLHRCDNPPCVNPHHLFLGTPRENVQDMRDKGREKHPHGSQVHFAKLNEKQVREIRKRYARGESQVELRQEYGIASATISYIVTRKTWKHVE